MQNIQPCTCLLLNMWIFILPFPLTAFAGWPKGIYITMSHASSSHEWSRTAFITWTEMPCYESRSLNPYLPKGTPPGWGIGTTHNCTAPLIIGMLLLQIPFLWPTQKTTSPSVRQPEVWGESTLTVPGLPVRNDSLAIGMPMRTQ